MKRLKADFHTHCADDPCDELHHSAEMLIEAAAQSHVDVLAITCHEYVAHTARLEVYAHVRGILLIPGIERTIDGRHVVILNPDSEQAAASTFAELRQLGRRDAAFIAPHPFYPSIRALGRDLDANIDVFDAIEYCSLYMSGLNFNRRAMRLAKRSGLPMAGSSDTHELPYRDSTHTWVEAEPTVQGVIEAIRAGRVSVATRPRPVLSATRSGLLAAWGAVEQLRDVQP